MRLVALVVVGLCLGAIQGDDTKVNPGIKVTLNSLFFKTAINNLITYMGSLKTKNNICEMEDGSTR